MKKIEEKIINFDVGSTIKFESSDKGVNITLQAPHFGDQIKIISMNVLLTKEEVIEIKNWLISVSEE